METIKSNFVKLLTSKELQQAFNDHCRSDGSMRFTTSGAYGTRSYTMKAQTSKFWHFFFGDQPRVEGEDSLLYPSIKSYLGCDLMKDMSNGDFPKIGAFRNHVSVVDEVGTAKISFIGTEDTICWALANLLIGSKNTICSGRSEDYFSAYLKEVDKLGFLSSQKGKVSTEPWKCSGPLIAGVADKISSWSDLNSSTTEAAHFGRKREMVSANALRFCLLRANERGWAFKLSPKLQDFFLNSKESGGFQVLSGPGVNGLLLANEFSSQEDYVIVSTLESVGVRCYSISGVHSGALVAAQHGLVPVVNCMNKGMACAINLVPHTFDTLYDDYPADEPIFSNGNLVGLPCSSGIMQENDLGLVYSAILAYCLATKSGVEDPVEGANYLVNFISEHKFDDEIAASAIDINVAQAFNKANERFGG